MVRREFRRERIGRQREVVVVDMEKAWVKTSAKRLGRTINPGGTNVIDLSYPRNLFPILLRISSLTPRKFYNLARIFERGL